MKKYIAIVILFLMLFTPAISVNAYGYEAVEALDIPTREIPSVENTALNESSSFANIVIFIKFSDEEYYTAPYDYDYYETMFNSLSTVSLKNYYLEVSYGQLTIESYILNDGTTMIYYQDINDRSFYEQYDEVTNPNGYDETVGNTQKAREHALLKRAIDYVEANNLVDESINLDVNDDGDIDSITFMVSGEDNGWNTLLWPHKWSLSTYYNYTNGEYESDAPYINGKYAYSYTFELLGDSKYYDYIVDVGVLAHETFHLISAPDLYHYYEYFNIEPVGDWGLMDGSTDTPSHMLGYMKEKYGNWISSVDEISESGTYTLAPMSESGDNLYKIDLGYSNEYIYIEYRVQYGIYESNLPGSGLLAYRVDLDFFDEGNVDGYYDTYGHAIDELFIFRPGISTNPLPIVFPEIDDEAVDEDGDINSAAISNNNAYSEMGNNTEIPMFYTDGTLIDIKIYNVLEHDGVITFDVYIPPRIELISEVDIPDGTDLYLYSGEGFEYRMNITNIPSNAQVYYTLDGTTPSTSSTLYSGGTIYFDESSNVINANVYIDGVLVSELAKEYTFVSEIQTEHNPYGDHQDITWYLDLADDVSTYELHFFSNSYLEQDYDYVYVTSSDQTLDFTGNQVSNLNLSYNEDTIVNFVTDEYDDGYYGFYIEIDFLIDVQLNINGNRELDVDVDSIYTDLGAELGGSSASLFTLETLGSVDTSVLGEYIITYNVLDDNLDIIKTGIRTVNVVDRTPPVVTLIGEEVITIEVFGDYTDTGVTYSDNFDTTLDYEVINNVDTDIVGAHIIEYTVTDLSGNITTVSRTVNIIDTVSPTATLEPGIDTVYVKTTHIDASVNVLDNYYTEFDITVNSNVEIMVVGTYTIEYTITDGSGNIVELVRYVNVIDEFYEVVFVIGTTVNTIKIGNEFTPASCSLGGELTDYAYSCSVDISKVDTSNAGTYRVLYYVEIDDVLYTEISYVFVYDSNDFVVWYYDKSRRGYL